MHSLKNFLKYFYPHKKYFFTSIFFNVLYSFFSALSMLSLMPMLNVLFSEGEKKYEKPVFNGFSDLNKTFIEEALNYFITTNTETEGPLSTLIWMVVFVLLTFLLKNFFSFMAIVYMTILNNGILEGLRNDVYQKVTSLPVSFFSNERKGDLISRMTADINTIRTSFLSVIQLVGREPLTILFTILAMLWISWKLTIFVIVFIPISGYVISLLGKSIKSQSGNIFQMEGELLSTIEETLGGIRIIKNFTSERFFNNRFFNFTKEINDANNKIGIRLSLAAPMSEFLGIFVISVLLIYGGSLVLIEGSMSGGSFIAYMGLSYQILTPAKAMAKANHALMGGNAASDRVAFILDAENPLKDKPNAKVIENFEKEICFKNVWFKYENEYVLKDFSLTVKKGMTVALVGQSGSGKSTLANLTTRFWDVSKGEISIDGVNVKDVTSHSLREQMGIVDQNPILFNDTIKNNIALGLDNVDDESIINAGKVANAHEFVNEFPAKYESIVGDGGGLLSGGQRQRIAIARAVMKNPPIMILDEATSALDTESEKLVQDALENMMENRTSLVIAHRLSTVQKADLIVVLNKGIIVEQGTHEELLAMKGTYRNLVDLQSLEVS